MESKVVNQSLFWLVCLIWTCDAGAQVKSDPDEVAIEPEETPSPEPQQPTVEEAIEASAPEVGQPEPTPVPTPGLCRAGTFADVYWVKEDMFDVSGSYAATINTDDARNKARFEGGGIGVAPPRYNCTACPVGRYSNRTGIFYDGCLKCPNGTFSNDPHGAIFCKPCQRGSYQVKEDKSSCDLCPQGRFMNETGEGKECRPW